MATKTPNHKLIKPDMTDIVDISMINTNWDTLDTALKHVMEESGSNENGTYIRFSDGTQICWIGRITIPYVSNNTLAFKWVFPAEFINSDISLSSGFNAPPIGKRSISFPVAMATNRFAGELKLLNDSGTSYDSTDTATAYPIAIGRWK